MSNFVHLHNHTDFSLLDAAQSIEMMCDRIEELGMDTIAVTEHGNLFSIIPFYKEAKKRDIKPILGCEVFVAVGKHTDRKQVTDGSAKKWGYHHLVLLVQNETGYRNLMKLVSIGYIDGFYYRPRVDKDLLRKYNEGLICTSACLAGQVNFWAAKGDFENAKLFALEYAEIFPDRYYLELQNHQIPEEAIANEILIKLAHETNLPLVATNDNHYAREEHSEAHDILFCLGKGTNLDDPNRRRYVPRQFYIKSADEMYELFKHVPEALENTLRIAEQCDVELPMGKLHLPRFNFPNEAKTDDSDEYLKILCEEGLKSRYPTITPKILERLNYELGVIKKMEYAGYFLITADFVVYAEKQGIPVGPGRGSAAGSLVAYATGITKVDPLKYNLLFERFLNPDRVSMPDIDIDFCIEGRQKVIDYIKGIYGKKSVAQIITFGRMKAKSVIRDVGRVLGMSYGEVDRIAKLIPLGPKVTLEKSTKINKDLADVSGIDDLHKRLMEFSLILEGLHRHAATHAAGVVIAPGPLTDYVSLYKAPSSGDITTQVEMNSLEDLGLLKVDFLGLRNLTVIDKTIKMIKKYHDIHIDIDNLDLTDQKTYNLFAEGRTIGIFQFESGGMQEYLKQLKPTNLEDLIAMNALYRPGPMQNIPNFIARKHGKEKIDYHHESLKSILKETYGVIVYQEQVMQIGSIIAGFTLAQADEMRRAMGKKKAEVMAAIKVDFVEGAVKNGLTKKSATDIFEILEQFAQYGFNKSHSTAYAIIAYQTAWLKTYYPQEFFAAYMNTEMDNLDRIVVLVDEAQLMGIEVLPPDVNTSHAEFTVTEDRKISYGLAAIKNVGIKISQNIANSREGNKEFKSIFDLVKSASVQLMNRKVLESLVLCGACDGLEGHRAQKFEVIEKALRFGQQYQQGKNSAQVDLFGDMVSSIIQLPEMPEIELWPEQKCLSQEKELLGFYLSGNPLAPYMDDLNEFNNVNISDFSVRKLPAVVRIGGIISEIKKLFDKKNRAWAIITISNNISKTEVFAFSSIFDNAKDIIQEDALVFISGKPSEKNEDGEILKIIADEIIPIQQVRQKFSKNINIRLVHELDDPGILTNINKIAEDNKGNCYLIFHLQRSAGTILRMKSRNIRVNPSIDFIKKLHNIVEVNNVWVD